MPRGEKFLQHREEKKGKIKNERCGKKSKTGSRGGGGEKFFSIKKRGKKKDYGGTRAASERGDGLLLPGGER